MLSAATRGTVAGMLVLTKGAVFREYYRDNARRGEFKRHVRVLQVEAEHVKIIASDDAGTPLPDAKHEWIGPRTFTSPGKFEFVGQAHAA